jgi:CRP/FNR family transcriptional regulator, cyclic AMP receptor protein
MLDPRELRRLKVLADLSEEQVAFVVGLIEQPSFRPNQVIVKEHAMGDCMFILFEGAVRVTKTVDGREIMLATLEAGDFFGEMCLFYDAPRSADVVANCDCRLLKITRQNFDALLQQRPDICALFLRAVIRVVAMRLRSMDKKYADSMLSSRFYAHPR